MWEINNIQTKLRERISCLYNKGVETEIEERCSMRAITELNMVINIIDKRIKELEGGVEKC